jgi:bis(5'-nucleosyl)-tetraphosphatase (symmetrical)
VQRIFVGDVQGCAEELEELQTRATSAFGDAFELWFVGDLVNRGPASLRVLARVRSLADAGRARCVVGNHELSLVRVALGLRALQPGDRFGDVLAAPDADDWIDWLLRWPVAELGRLGEQDFAMVHAAVAPGWTLAELAQRAARVAERLAASRADAAALLAAAPETDAEADDLARITRCRSVDRHGRWSSVEPERARDAWHHRWERHHPAYGVVYGHWATQGLHVAPGLRGLDTGCVYSGRYGTRHLTAWLPAPEAARPFDVPDDHFWQIRGRARGGRDRA